MGELKGKVVEVRSAKDSVTTRKIGESLRTTREMSGLTLAQMAKKIEVDQTAISNVESGRADMQVSTLEKYVEALGGTLRVDAGFSFDSPLSLRMLALLDVELDSEDQLVLPMFADEVSRRQSDVVLSIRPKYSSRILAGKKTVELRRRFPASAPRGTIAYAFIYSSSPERAMVGVAEIKVVRKLAVAEIWERYSSVAFIDKPDFDAYFFGIDEGFVLEFGTVRPFESPLSLAELRARIGFEPPQSFVYAKQDLLRALKDEYTIVPH